jgi:uncharacterized protein
MMAVVSYPGVYVEEVSSGVRPVAAASTSTPAFVGLAERGPDDEAVRVTSWAEFQRRYGGFINGSYLAESVFQFFNNGGQQCYIVRVTGGGAAAADVTVRNRAAAPVAGLKFSAKNKGEWGNYLYLQIENGTADPGNEFKISIRQQEEVDVVPDDFLDILPLEVHDNLSIDPDAPNYVESALRRRSSLIDAEVLDTKSLQRGSHRGGLEPTLPLKDNQDFQINVDHDGFQLVQLPSEVANSSDLAEIAKAITEAVRGLRKRKSSTPGVAFSAFVCTVETVGDKARLVLQSGSERDTSSIRIQDASTNNSAASLKLGAANGGFSENALAVRRPANADVVQIGDNAIEAPVAAATLGTDGEANFTDESYYSRFALLDNKTDFSLLAVPGIGSTPIFDAGVAYCEKRPLRDVFFIGEMEQHRDTLGGSVGAEGFRKSLTKPNSYGALYFPWIRALDPSGRSAEPILLPPSGYIAGLYARIDARRGVWKAPAGTEATLSGALGLAVDLTDVQQGSLNSLNVNCIRRFSASGIVAWGARTITSDPEWTYVPVRRTAIMLRVSIYDGIQWAVFEPNDEELWASLRLNISAFMMTLFRRGAFQGAMPSEAFFVKCDRETNPQESIDLGIVTVLVGFAPLKPAEFVVVRISQKAGQTS